MSTGGEVKLSDIAKELNVSIVTVSNALGGKKGVGAELRQKILQKADELGYVPKKGTAKKKARVYCIGVMAAERYMKAFPCFYMDVYRQIAQEAAKKGCFTLLEIVSRSRENAPDGAEFFSGMKVDGILILGEMDMTFVSAIHKNQPVPVVGVDFYDVSENMDYIVTDSFHGMECVTRHLVEAGCKTIGFLGNPYATRSIMDRYMGYCMALEKCGIPEKKEFLIFDRGEDNSEESIHFELPGELPEGFAVNCDRSAWLLIEKLRERGLRVPEDVSVAGFDHSEPPAQETLTLATYESDGKALAQESLHVLLKRIGKKPGEKFSEGIRIVAGRFIPGTTIRSREAAEGKEAAAGGSGTAADGGEKARSGSAAGKDGKEAAEGGKRTPETTAGGQEQ